jgi:ubiquitin C-terminal hydrolase
MEEPIPSLISLDEHRALVADNIMRDCDKPDITVDASAAIDAASEDTKPKKLTVAEFTTRGLSGLTNFGSTCYMNAAIQSLSATREFLAYMIHPDSELLEHLKARTLDDLYLENDVDNKKNGTTKELSITDAKLIELAKQKLPYKLRLMMKRIWANNCEVKPKQLKRYVDKKLKFFAGGFNQHDSQEFLSALLDNIHESTKAKGIITYKLDLAAADLEKELKLLETELAIAQKEKATDKIKEIIDKKDMLLQSNPKAFLKIRSIWAWEGLLKSAYSIVNDIFSGMTLATLTCVECKKITFNFARDDLLTLHLPEVIEEDRTSYTIQELLKHYTASESVSDTNKNYCDYCGTKTDIMKKHDIYHQPNVLVLMIKKYQKFNGSILKTNVKINYPHILDIKEYMSEYVDTDTKYELYSVIRHSGGVDGGHYYTYSKNMINGLWFLHDDGDVFNVDESEPLNCNGYILFYRLI